MSLRIILIGLACLTPAAAVGQGGLLDRGRDLLQAVQPGTGQTLDEGDIAGGLKEALKLGSERVVALLGQADGFNRNADAHISLPGALEPVQRVLRPLGMGRLGDDLELRLNRAAESATPAARRLFWDAIDRMTLQDAKGILSGPDDAATQYFRRQMSEPLARSMRPIVDRELADAGAIDSLEKMLGQYRTMPLVPDVRADLGSHVVDHAIDAIFLYLGREETAIRHDPAKRTTDLLRRVFGG